MKKIMLLMLIANIISAQTADDTIRIDEYNSYFMDSLVYKKLVDYREEYGQYKLAKDYTLFQLCQFYNAAEINGLTKSAFILNEYLLPTDVLNPDYKWYFPLDAYGILIWHYAELDMPLTGRAMLVQSPDFILPEYRNIRGLGWFNSMSVGYDHIENPPQNMYEIGTPKNAGDSIYDPNIDDFIVLDDSSAHKYNLEQTVTTYETIVKDSIVIKDFESYLGWYENKKDLRDLSFFYVPFDFDENITYAQLSERVLGQLKTEMAKKDQYRYPECDDKIYTHCHIFGLAVDLAPEGLIVSFAIANIDRTNRMFED